MIHQYVTSWYKNIKLSTHDSPTCDIMVQEYKTKTESTNADMKTLSNQTSEYTLQTIPIFKQQK